MSLCNRDHDKVYYESRYCPVCEAHIKGHELEVEVYDLQQQVHELLNQLHSYEEDYIAWKTVKDKLE